MKQDMIISNECYLSAVIYKTLGNIKMFFQNINLEKNQSKV